MSQKAGTTIRIDLDIEEAVWVKLARERRPLSKLVNAFLREWVAADINSNETVPMGYTGPSASVIKQLHQISQRFSDLSVEFSEQIAKAEERPQESNKNGKPVNPSAVAAEGERLAQAVLERMARLDQGATLDPGRPGGSVESAGKVPVEAGESVKKRKSGT